MNPILMAILFKILKGDGMKKCGGEACEKKYLGRRITKNYALGGGVTEKISRGIPIL